MGKAVIAIHGGAGAISRAQMSLQQELRYIEALSAIVETGQKMLEAGESALDVVTEAVRLLEECPLFNAGIGAVFTRDETHELDACVMDGNTLKAGAVAGVSHLRNPVLAARCFLLICFAGRMTYFVYDGVTGPTPLARLKAGEAVNTMDMLIGNIRGTIGETSVIAIMIGAMFLLLMGVIELEIPASYLVSFVVFIVIFGGHGFDPQYITAHLCGGGLMLGVWFMATDYVTSPITSSGKIIYGVCMGLLTGLFRIFGGSAEGVSYAIIISNLLVPLIEKITLPKPFGKGGEKHE